MENTKPGYTGTVLLAESERSLREMVGMRLAREGYRVVPVNDGEQALQVAARHEHDIDLLMTDVLLPRFYGWLTPVLFGSINQVGLTRCCLPCKMF